MISLPMLTVSIVTYHTSHEELAGCLSSLDSPCVKAIYVVDNASEETMRSFCLNYPKVVYIPSENKGYGAGHNVAIRRIMADNVAYHLVVNSDIKFDPGMLPRMIDLMERHPGVGQLHPRVINPDGSMQWTVRRLPTPIDLIGRRFLPQSWTRRRNDRYLLKHLDHNRPMNIPYHQGSFMLLRTDALRRTGLFDERFFMYPEDIDLTRRIHRSYVTLYWPHEQIVHDHRAESYAGGRMLRIHMANMIRYFFKWGWIADKERRRENRKLDNGTAYVDIS